ncbi:hypothetical protein M513_13447 [Trichuris suis]|uniref:Uncharacterized protein n=1 Tax=Trichuris suis TaxID=68888 RepID=A0A085LL29_9BILA|nr:hypothetical protein M513_13447 [Trichuris suis]
MSKCRTHDSYAMGNHCKLTLPYKNSLTNQAASVGATMVLLWLLALSLLVQLRYTKHEFFLRTAKFTCMRLQPAVQESREWRDERKGFQQAAINFFFSRLAPIKILHLKFSEYDKCPHKNRSPYGLGTFTLGVSCPNPDPSYCGLYGTRRDGSEVMVVECQFAAELNGRGRPIAALCYQNTTTGGRGSRGEAVGGEMCKKWRYPGTELPQLQLPGYLRSPDADVLWYDPANLESFDVSGSRSREVLTTRWIRNRYERTGFSGKGKLEEYGANMALYLLITRYSYGTTKVLIEDTDDRVALPRFWVKKDKIDADLIKRKVSKLNLYCKPSDINVMVKTRQKYHTGYLKNKHNTDNAWLEGPIIHLHDQSDQGSISWSNNGSPLACSTIFARTANFTCTRLQSAAQLSRERRDERNAFQQAATNFFMRTLAPIHILRLWFLEYDKCPHKNRSPYGLGKFTLHVTCPQRDPSYCGLYGTRRDGYEVMVVDCQFAAELNHPGKVIAALCYQNTTTGGRGSRGEAFGGEMCKKWSYPGTQLPQLQLPEYLKSRNADILWYDPANLESFDAYYSKSREVRTTRWILNQYERTGFSGKGKLEEYGANAALYLLITRYSHGTTKVLMEYTDDRVTLPRFWVKKDKIDADLIKRKVSKLALHCSQNDINVMVQTRQRFYTGYLKNKHNTDNAWLEGPIIHLHDQSHSGCFSPYPTHTDARSRKYRWDVLPYTTTPRDFARTFGINSK